MSTYTDVIAQSEDGTRRVRIELDEYPDAPDFPTGCPVLRAEVGIWSSDVTHTGYGSESAAGDGLPNDAEDILTKFINDHGFSKGIDTFDRYLRIFHNGRAVRRDAYRYSDATYVAYITERMVREVWGSTDIDTAIVPEMSEWMAYVDGDVYVVITEERASVTERRERADGSVEVRERMEWEEVDSVHGFYGYECAEEVARQMI